MPWMARAMISTVIEWASPATTEPAASAASVTTSIRSLPTMSPTRPRIGVKIDADSRNAVSTQVTVFWVVCRSCWNGGQHRGHQRLQQGVRRHPGREDGERHLISRALPDLGHPHLHISGTWFPVAD